ncbi:hypothetical protein PR202_gb27272 [Eleusine coracana subsp. coracana]|uniref:CASP-like protein n=1 Tax=Eleusine coracana subsp. coracana TaxID=191504 RepID=A0AAV5FUB0_ELECO|nr:hypothetical protein PR202_gb27272 [Eleusine coracana subsp. coracana]
MASISMITNAVRVVLRAVTAAAAGVAAVVMATSQEMSDAFVFGFQMEAKFQYSPSLVFFVIANAVACAYSLLALIVPLESPAARFVLMADVIVSMLLSGAIGAAAAVSDLGKNGNSHAFWQPICGLVETFCQHVGGALISSLVAVILCFLALIYSIYALTKPTSSTESQPQP